MLLFQQQEELHCPFEEYGCKFLHESKEPTDKSIDEQDAFKHLTTSTPVKVDDKITQCKICIQNINPGQKFYKCEECEHKICENCALKTHLEDDPEYFMCLECQSGPQQVNI